MDQPVTSPERDPSGADPTPGVRQHPEGPWEHRLKTWPEYFAAVKSGRKSFELRVADRAYCLGDYLVLQEWEPNTGHYTGAEVRVGPVTHVCNVNGFIPQLDCDFVILGFPALRAAGERPGVPREELIQKILTDLWPSRFAGTPSHKNQYAAGYLDGLQDFAAALRVSPPKEMGEPE